LLLLANFSNVELLHVQPGPKSETTEAGFPRLDALSVTQQTASKQQMIRSHGNIQFQITKQTISFK